MSKNIFKRLEERVCDYLFGKVPEPEFKFPEHFDRLSTLEKSCFYREPEVELRPKHEDKSFFPEIYDNIDKKNNSRTLKLKK